jgi:hypothetical protein
MPSVQANMMQISHNTAESLVTSIIIVNTQRFYILKPVKTLE